MKRQGHTSNGGLQKTILMIMKILLIQPLLVQEVKLIVSRRTRRPVVVVAHLVEKKGESIGGLGRVEQIITIYSIMYIYNIISIYI